MSTTRDLNDAFRKGERPEIGRIVITSGVRSVVAAWPLGVAMLYDAVKKFDAFTSDNDPYDEHDFGSLDFAGEKIFWKLDYYDQTLAYGSPDPANTSVTTRVLTIMLAQEY